MNDKNENNFKEDFSEDTKKKNSLFREILGWIIPLAIAVIVAFIISRFIILNTTIVSGSMETTLMTGTHVMGNRLAYLFDTPERGEIIFFKSPDNDDEIFIKRIIGLPGETVHIRNNEIYINDNFYSLEEPYTTGITTPYFSSPDEPFYGVSDFVIPEGSYFALGDNRERSRDSRAWGFVKEEDIYARAFVLYWPFSDFKLLKTPEYSIDAAE